MLTRMVAADDAPGPRPPQTTGCADCGRVRPPYKTGCCNTCYTRRHQMRLRVGGEDLAMTRPTALTDETVRRYAGRIKARLLKAVLKHPRKYLDEVSS